MAEKSGEEAPQLSSGETLSTTGRFSLTARILLVNMQLLGWIVLTENYCDSSLTMQPRQHPVDWFCLGW